MLFISFFSWWYGRGWAQVATSFKPRTKSIAANFSTRQLSRTLFAPWRQITTDSSGSLQDKFRAWGDNVFSRIVGFTIRSTVLFAAGVSIIAVAIITALELVLWPLLPPAVPALLIVGALL